MSNPDAQMSAKITNQLLSFSSHLKMKSGGIMQLDSATWYLEGLLNLEKANNNHQFEGLNFFYDTIVMYTSGNSLTMDELNTIYTYLNSKLDLIIQTQNGVNFAFDAIDISYTNEGLKNGEILLLMGVGGGPNTIGNYVAFGSTDYWVWGLQGGKCGAYAGQGGLSDAAQQLNYKFNHSLAIYEPGFFTDIEHRYAYGDEYPDSNNPGPYCDYKIFMFDSGNTGIWPCLSPTELNFYLSTLPFIINDKRPEGKSYINVSVTAYFAANYTNIYSHVYYLQYGIFNPSGLNN